MERDEIKDVKEMAKKLKSNGMGFMWDIVGISVEDSYQLTKEFMDDFTHTNTNPEFIKEQIERYKNKKDYIKGYNMGRFICINELVTVEDLFNSILVNQMMRKYKVDRIAEESNRDVF